MKNELIIENLCSTFLQLESVQITQIITVNSSYIRREKEEPTVANFNRMACSGTAQNVLFHIIYTTI